MKKPFKPSPVSLGDKTWPSMAAAARELGLSRQALWNRLHRMPKADALRDAKGREVVFKKRACRFVLVDGHPISTQQCAEHFQVTIDTVYRWIKSGRLATYGTARVCSHCKEPGHRFNTCPALYLRESAPGRALPPREKELRAAGILPKAPPDEDWP